MISNKAIYIKARLFIKMYGADAESHALAHMRELAKIDDAKDASVWLAVMQAIQDLSYKHRGESVH